MLTVSGKALGQRKPLFADYSVPLPPTTQGGTTLRDLIAHVVRAEVVAFRDRQAERKLLKALSAPDRGRGRKGQGRDGRERRPARGRWDQAVATAIQAFEDGLYLVVLDGEEQKDLDRPLPLTEASRVAFVRLAMLAGG